MSTSSVHSTVGSILVGSLVSIFLSGVVSMQVVTYQTYYSDDPAKIKAAVVVIWFLDVLHTIFICIANWDYLITGWGERSTLLHIPWPIAATVAVTALMTFFVQCFFSYRVFKVSRHNGYIAIPMALLALMRLVAALVSTAEMIMLKDFDLFRQRYGWVFTFGLSLSAAVDILVTFSLCYYLRQGRTGFKSMDTIVNTLTFYAIQNGMLTGVTAVVSLACWVSMSNLIFLGSHLAIAKLYAASFMATLNARRSLRTQQLSVDRFPTMMVNEFSSNSNNTRRNQHQTSEDIPMSGKVNSKGDVVVQVQIDVEQEFHDETGKFSI
ncbi:hypothetical protein SCP_0101530 [Sparassis crispa]|uniref:DUF6534 domain-containing protein n=1 Tax=Sparassis crispa TaxID=139825 RepID=A0A401G546_9APHY|nr:hypothetical protein SCP_0101530 [Sparassis crispa]GBE77280.1 hypothetical protein SCP_0101530 [Sparassis crispa]